MRYFIMALILCSAIALAYDTEWIIYPDQDVHLEDSDDVGDWTLLFDLTDVIDSGETVVNANLSIYVYDAGNDEEEFWWAVNMSYNNEIVLWDESMNCTEIGQILGNGAGSINHLGALGKIYVVKNDDNIRHEINVTGVGGTPSYNKGVKWYVENNYYNITLFSPMDHPKTWDCTYGSVSVIDNINYLESDPYQNTNSIYARPREHSNVSARPFLRIWTNEPASDSCTYTSSDWNVNCYDNCTITSNVNIDAGSNVTISGYGFFDLIGANLTGFERLLVQGLNPSLQCEVFVKDGIIG